MSSHTLKPRSGVGPTLLSPTRALALAAAGMSLIAVCYGLARFAYGLFVPAFRESFALDASATGVIASGSYVAYCAGILAATLATPWWGARRTAVLAGVLATLGTALIALTPGVVLLVAGVMLAGASTGLASPPLAHAIARRVHPGARSRLQTVVNAGTGLGVLVSGPVALLAGEHWRFAWWVFAGAAALVTAWAAVAVPSGPRRAAAGVPVPRRALPGGGRPPAGAAHLLLAAAVVGGSSAATWTFGPDLLTSDGGHGQSFATLAWIVLGACGLLGAVTGDATQRFGLRTVWACSLVALGAATAVLAAAPQDPVVALLAHGAFGGVYIVLTGVLLLWGAQVFGREPARGVGLAFLFLALGQGGAAPLLGVLADQAGLPAAFWAASGIALLGLLVPAGGQAPSRSAGVRGSTTGWPSSGSGTTSASSP
ncbi:MFS transporter [Micrococcus sp. TA1]|uniref:MFS transporter n=1 Tax=Micrococcus sp. TA1 TaxID=681627 RepID=UPI001622AE47|nr:MFS transporter [Micrococcus sp. TA1]MBB5750570.1 putative MFS family arabinose efflux permease [Micrococcus sp. TA1]